MSGGQCACCGFSHMFLPNGSADLIAAVSDLETDAQENEIAALERHPWPRELRDQVWADRVRLRQRCKKDVASNYRKFWADHSDGFKAWMREELSHDQVRRVFQLPRSELMEVIRSPRYDIHSAFAVVLCAAVEQVAFFRHTEYPPDSERGGGVELDFERVLTFDRRGGFTMPLVKSGGCGEESTWDADVLEIWFKRMEALGGPKLLDRGPSSKSRRSENGGDDDDDDGDAGGDDDEGGDVSKSATKSGEGYPTNPAAVEAGPSFRSDRRMVRLLIARYWADALQKRYLAYLDEQQHPEGEQAKLPQTLEDGAETPAETEGSSA